MAHDALTPISFSFPPEAVKPLVEQVVAEAVERLAANNAALPDGRLAYSEEEAARLLSLGPHVLRDERRRGRIGASAIVGRRIRYTRDDLLNYLQGRRYQPTGERAR